MRDANWSQIDWNDLYPRLLLYAAGKLNRLIWRGERRGHVPGGMTADDFVQEAIKRTIAGERNWNPNISLYDHLVGVISGLISHRVNSSDNKTTVRADEKIVHIEDHRSTPETAAIRKAQEAYFLAYLELKNSALRKLASLMLQEPFIKTPDLMIKLNLSLTSVESLKRALRRATEEYLRSEEGGGRLAK